MAQDPDVSPRAPSARAAFFGACAFLIGLVLAAYGMRQVADVHAPRGDNKLRALARGAAKHDTVVIGSSVIGVGFRKQVFDRRMTARGFPSDAFAIGIGGMFGAELDFYLHEVLQMDLPKLRWLVLDVTLKQHPHLDKENYYTRRVIDWHNPSQYAIVQGQIMESARPLQARLEALSPHVEHLLLNVLNVGNGVRVVESMTKRVKHGKRVSAAKARNRAKSAKRHGALRDRKAARYAENRRAHFKAVRKSIALREKGVLRSNELAVTWRDLARERGVNVAFLVGPATSYAGFEREVPGGERLALIDLNDPRKHRKLFTVASHYDRIHLTRPGSRLFSAAMASRLAKMRRKEQR